MPEVLPRRGAQLRGHRKTGVHHQPGAREHSRKTGEVLREATRARVDDPLLRLLDAPEDPIRARAEVLWVAGHANDVHNAL
eukprot:5291721-Pyramimonas_sp.AAC.1